MAKEKGGKKRKSRSTSGADVYEAEPAQAPEDVNWRRFDVRLDDCWPPCPAVCRQPAAAPQAEQPSDDAKETVEEDEEISEEEAFTAEDERLYGSWFSGGRPAAGPGQYGEPGDAEEGEEGEYDTDDFSEADEEVRPRAAAILSATALPEQSQACRPWQP